MQTSFPTVADSTAKMYAATAMSQTLSFCMERKYLEKIGDEQQNPLYTMKEVAITPKDSVSWIEISQIGKPLDDDAESCFTAIQKILYSCFMPQETQLLFLIVKNDKQNKMYLGVRPMGSKNKESSVLR